MNKELVKGLVDQINMEFEAAYIYLGMSAYLDGDDYPGFGQWMMAQSQEEVTHAMKLYHYLQERGERIELQAINEVSVDYDSVQDVFEKALAHEKEVTASIDKLMNKAHDLKDFSAMGMLQWFVDEQVEEEDTFNAALAKIRRAENKGSALLMLDSKFGKRQE